MPIQAKPLSSRNNHLQEALSEVQKTDELVKLTVQVPKKMRSEFKIKAEMQGTNMSTLILEYVKQYISK
jgi:predicted DNA binding CopG/RHH family protein